MGFVSKLMDGAKNYSVADFAVLKTGLLALGVITGISFPRRLQAFFSLFMAVYLVSLVYIIVRTLSLAEKDE
ncbi:hypothetical protein [Alkalicoccus luteus]|uniref:hypothetical protein n=1 Tax=Alkalicoccus luteus TaxID=1237094 RepID=UPI0040338117